MLRSRAFMEAYGRAVAAGLVGLDEAVRLLRMGGSPLLCASTVLCHAPEWGGELLLALPAWVWSCGCRCIRALTLATGSPCPAHLLPTLLVLGVVTPDQALVAYRGLPDDAELMDHLLLATDGLFLSGRAKGLVQHMLRHACRTSEAALTRLLDAIEAIPTPVLRTSDRDAVVELCRTHSPHLADRVAALACERKYHGFGVNYNVLRIMIGLGGLAYSK